MGQYVSLCLGVQLEFANLFQADSIIPSINTRFYYNGVMEKDKNVHDYYRNFEAPGVGHCASTGTGLYPQGIFRAL
jgi:hypothetical protein